MYIVRTLIGIDHFQVRHMTHDRVVIRDAITPEHVPSAAGNIQRLAAGIAFDETDEIGLDLACRQHFARLEAALQGQTNLGLHIR